MIKSELKNQQALNQINKPIFVVQKVEQTQVKPSKSKIEHQ